MIKKEKLIWDIHISKYNQKPHKLIMWTDKEWRLKMIDYPKQIF